MHFPWPRLMMLTAMIAVAGEAPATARAAGPVKPRGASAIVSEVDFRNTPLDRAIEKLQELTGENIAVRWHALEKAGIKRSTPVDLAVARVPLGSVIKLLGDAAGGGDAAIGLGARDERGVVIVSTRDDIDAATIRRVYDVRDLIESDLAAQLREVGGRPTTLPTNDRWELYYGVVQRLRQAIEGTIEPDSWFGAGGTVGSIHDFNGRLIIAHTPVVHRRIEELLAELRRK